MQNSRLAPLLFILLALAVAGGAWFAFREGHEPAMPTAAEAAGAPTSKAAGEAAQAEVANGATTEVVDAGERVAAAPTVDQANGSRGKAILGQVVDGGGQPVGDALVRCSQGFGPEGGGEVDFGEMFSDFDPEAMAERFRNAARQSTEVRTDAEGRFRIVPEGTGRVIALRVVAPKCVVLDRSVARPVEADLDLGVLSLKAGATVRGRVLDAAGQPIQGARVSRVGVRNRAEGGGPMEFLGDFDFPGADAVTEMVGDQQAVSGADGTFALEHCSPGDFALQARHADHPQARSPDLQVAAGAELANVLVTMAPGAVLRGKVVGMPEGIKSLRVMAAKKRDAEAKPAGEDAADNPLTVAFNLGGEMFAESGFGERQERVAADGSFELRGLQVGVTYRLWAVQGGRGFAGMATCTPRLEVASGTVGIELRYDPGIVVTCQVVDSKSGAPIEQLWVREQLRGGGGGIEDLMAFAPRSGRAKTYPDGRVVIANLRPKPKQNLTLSIDALGFAPFERKGIDLPTQGTLDLGVLRLDPAPVVAVRVVDRDGAPVAGAQVRVAAETDGATANDNPFEAVAQSFGGGRGTGAGRTDAQGGCILNAPATRFTVRVTSKDHAPYRSEPMEVPAAGAEHRVVLLRGGVVVVRVLDAGGAAAAGARVEQEMPDGQRATKDADKEGLARFTRLAPGVHAFRLSTNRGMPGAEFLPPEMLGGGAKPAARGPEWQSVEVADGAEATVTLTKPASAMLAGVVRENGVPVSGARVAFAEGAEDANEGGIEARMADFAGEFGGGGRGRSARTGADGAYQLKDLPEGAHRLRISVRSRAMPATVAVVLRTGENVFDVDLDVTVVRGTVRDPAGAPVAGATITIQPVKAPNAPRDERAAAIEEAMGSIDLAQLGGGGRAVKTAADGSFELRGVEAGRPWQVRATAKGMAAAVSASVELTPGGTREGVDITLGAAGKVRVEASGVGGFAQVKATKVGDDGAAEAGVAPVSAVMQRGKGTLDGLRPGRWKVEVRSFQGDSPAPVFVVVKAGETATVQM